jgi:hypothetical protein
MRTKRIIPTTPKESARDKNVSVFKTISFLESFPENEPNAGFSDTLRVDTGDHTQVIHEGD